MLYATTTSPSSIMMFRRIVNTATTGVLAQASSRQSRCIVMSSLSSSSMPVTASSPYNRQQQKEHQHQLQQQQQQPMFLSSSFMQHHSTMTTPNSTNNSNKKEEKNINMMMKYHTTTNSKQADVTAVAMDTTTASTTSAAAAATTATSPFMKRWIITAEASISKIFPAGFGWQAGSLIAANTYGYASDSLNFALCTGIGDAIGVLGGHCLYYSIKKSLFPTAKINMIREVHVGLWLGCAAFCSGTVWQPIVTTLQMNQCTFTQVMIGTWITCATAFYVGLRAGRTLLPLSSLAQPTYANSQTDIALSISIGGATGFFVGTDAAYLPEQNFLLPIVGITDSTTDMMGCTLAGTSTALGFVSSQSVLNTIYPKEKCWND